MVDLRDALTEHLRGDDLDDLDRELVRWLVGEIQRRVQAGPIRPDVATLAARVVDSFADTPEGAALRASLPNLRRSAGLCPALRPAPPGRPRHLPPMPGRRPPSPRPAVGRARPRGEPMSLRLRCRSCQAAFVTSDDQAGQTVDCPKCGAAQVVPRPKPPPSPTPTRPRSSG